MFIITGCSVKQSDNPHTKVVKHTVNAPVYILYGTGKIATEASEIVLMSTISGVGKVIKK